MAHKVVVPTDILYLRILVASARFGAFLDETIHAQNASKQVHVPCVVGLGAAAETRKLYSEQQPFEGAVSRCSRYLGPYINDRGTMVDELPRMVQRTRVGWLSMGGFWTSHAPLVMRLVVFNIRVVNAALSGLTAFIATATVASTRPHGAPLHPGASTRSHQEGWIEGHCADVVVHSEEG